jgi:hypothetical protein
MALPYTVDDLLADAKLRAFLPTSNTSTTSLSDSDILRLANDELWASMTPKIQAAVEEFFVVEYAVPISPPQVAFDVPARATGGQLRDVYLIPAGGNAFQRRKIPRFSPEQIQTFQANPQQLSSANGPAGFWMQGNQVVLWPFTQTADTLILSTFFRPNQMVPVVNCNTITAINYSTGVVSFAAAVVPPYAANVLCDFVRAVPGFDPLIFDIPIVSVSGGTITFAANQLTPQQTRIAVGDYVCVAGTAPVPQIPQTLHPLLAARTALRICRAIGDRGNAEVLAQDVADMESTMYTVLSPRVESKSDVLVQLDLLGSPYPRYRLGGY